MAQPSFYSSIAQSTTIHLTTASRPVTVSSTSQYHPEIGVGLVFQLSEVALVDPSLVQPSPILNNSHSKCMVSNSIKAVTLLWLSQGSSSSRTPSNNPKSRLFSLKEMALQTGSSSCLQTLRVLTRCPAITITIQ